MSEEGLPEGWAEVSLEELCGPDAPIVYGIIQPGPEVSDGVPYVRPTELVDGGIDLANVRRTSPEIAKQYERSTLRVGDIILAIVGTIGKLAIVPRELAGANITQSSARIRPPDWMPAQYLANALKSPKLQAQYDEHEFGVAVRRLNLSHVRELRVPVAPLGEQRRIVHKIEALTSRSRRAKEALDAIPALLERFRQSVLAAAFRGDLTAAWREKNPDVEPAEELLKKIRAERRRRWEEAELAKMRAKGKAPSDHKWKERYEEPADVDTTELPELPDGWCWAGLSEVADIQLGQQRAPVHTSADVMLPYVRAANITWRGLDLTDIKQMGFPDPERYSLQPGDVLLNEASGSPLEVGKPAIWRGEIPGCCYQKTLLRVRPLSTNVTSEWLHLSFLRDALFGKFAAMAPGVGIVHLTAERMLNWPVPIAPLEEQRRLAQEVHAGLKRIQGLEELAADLSTGASNLNQALLAKAFRGELVPQDPADEPASVLLDRLRAERAQVEAKPKAGRRGRKVVAT